MIRKKSSILPVDNMSYLLIMLKSSMVSSNTYSQIKRWLRGTDYLNNFNQLKQYIIE